MDFSFFDTDSSVIKSEGKINMKKIVALITGVNLIGVIIVINLFFSFYPFWRIDLTKNQIHSLSATTQQTIKNLDDIVTIKVFMTADLPPQVKPIATSLKTILEEIGRLNTSKVKISYLDPLKDGAAKTDADRYGIQPLQFSSVKSDKFEVQSGYFGLALIYGKKQVVLPVANDVGNLEYFLTSGIKKLVSIKVPTVAIAEEDTSSNGQGVINYFRKFLEQNYTVIDATLDGDTALPPGAETLVIVGRTKKIDVKGISKIDAWVKSGKGLIGFISSIQVGQNMVAYKVDPSGLENIFKNYGMEIQPKLVWDANATVANFQTNNGSFLTQYPYWPQVTAANISNDTPITSGVNSLMLPWASPIILSGQARPLFTSSADSTVDDSFKDLTPTNTKSPGAVKIKSVMGAFNTSGVKLALIADSQVIQDQFVTNNERNLMLGLNLVDYFSQDTSLLTIRSKSLAGAPLMPVSETIKTWIKILNLVAPILILTLVAIGANIIRIKSNQRWKDESKF